jgi:hypothetical protein
MKNRLNSLLSLIIKEHTWKTHKIWSVYFHRPVRIITRKNSDRYIVEIYTEEPLSGTNQKTLNDAMIVLEQKLRKEIKTLHSTFTHLLSREQINRKGVLLSKVDTLKSKLIG